MSIENKQLEEGKELILDFSKLAKAVKACNTIIPVAVQDIETKEVILIAYTNQQAFEHTCKTKIATFWSTSRNELWIKGKSSGNTFAIKDIFVNCEQNSLVYIVQRNAGGICHTFNKSGEPRDCFYRKLDIKKMNLENIDP